MEKVRSCAEHKSEAGGIMKNVDFLIKEARQLLRRDGENYKLSGITEIYLPTFDQDSEDAIKTRECTTGILRNQCLVSCTLRSGSGNEVKAKPVLILKRQRETFVKFMEMCFSPLAGSVVSLPAKGNERVVFDDAIVLFQFVDMIGGTTQ